MHDRESATAIEVLLSQVRSKFIETAPELLYLFDIYASEAVFGWRFIALDLQGLTPGARVTEVGAGSLLLSCQLVRAGFDVTAIEPLGSGFSHFGEMRKKVLEVAFATGCAPTVLDFAAENLQEHERFDYAFSVNVMEHVDDIARVIGNVGRSLVVGASYRFTCPNYLFPYEPHFNIPTLISKKLTERVFHRKIFGATNMPDPSGTWKSLNWINVVRIRRVVASLPGLQATFNRLLLVSTLERVVTDKQFAGRRSPSIRRILLALVRLRLHTLFQFMPATVQPIIDCRVRKISSSDG